MNLLASAGVHEVDGEVLGFDVTIRFTPTGYVFHPGDGSTQQTQTGGIGWDRLGVPQFTPTSTSHVYADPGPYEASVQVLYAAEVDFGSGRWRPVQGTVVSAAAGFDVLVLELTTALVQHTCLESATDPGC